MSTSVERHARWVRISHWILTVSLLTLAFTGFVILMVHPRLYWGDAGNDLTPALLELPISRNYKHGGWDTPTRSPGGSGPDQRQPDLRHLQPERLGTQPALPGGVVLVLPGVVYLAHRHSRRPLPRAHLARGRELAPTLVWRDVVDHLRFRVPPASGGPQYGVLQKCRVLVRDLRGGAADGRRPA